MSVDGPFARALTSGAFAGLTVDLALYPLDTLKTRLQSPAGFLAAGGLRSLYAGVGSAALGAAPSAAIFFVTYESIKTSLHARRALPNRHAGSPLSATPLDHMLAASAGEIAACIIRVPTEVLKQRAQASQHRTSLAALRHILARRGDVGARGVLRELYRGSGALLLRELPFTMVQFPAWEGLKTALGRWRQRQRQQQEGYAGRGATEEKGHLQAAEETPQVAAWEGAACGAVAGALAGAVTTPLDVLKTRIVLAGERRSVLRVVGDVWNEGGWRALFAGVGPRVVWISVGGGVFLGSYQWAWNAFGKAL